MIIYNFLCSSKKFPYMGVKYYNMIHCMTYFNLLYVYRNKSLQLGPCLHTYSLVNMFSGNREQQTLLNDVLQIIVYM